MKISEGLNSSKGESVSIVVRGHFGELKICLFFHPYVPVQVSIILLQAPPGGLPESRPLPPGPPRRAALSMHVDSDNPT